MPARHTSWSPPIRWTHPATPIVAVRGEVAAKFLENLPEGPTTLTVTLDAAGPQREPAKLRNVIGVVRGSDSQLQDTYILVTAHYDHLGMKPAGDGDLIYNGANDDGSGTVSVIELASAIASMHPHPRRSVVFMTVFGEEKDLLGSMYYSRHPVFPFGPTVADVNLEQIGEPTIIGGRRLQPRLLPALRIPTSGAF